ncbi:hypothetical protein ACFLS9_07800 [Bacteroidota bacterium]
MTKQDEIKQILFNNDRTVKWLADKLGKERQGLHYQLNHASKFGIDLYEQIKKIFKNEGFLDNQCEYLLRQTLNVDAIVNNCLASLSDTVNRFTSDNILEFGEKKKLSELIEKIHNDVEHQLKKLSDIIER